MWWKKVAALAFVVAALAHDRPPSEYVGRWESAVQTPQGDCPSWLEVSKSGRRTLVGWFVGQAGSARPISRVEVTYEAIRFAVPPQWEPGPEDLRFEGRPAGEGLRGEMTDDRGRKFPWTARRAPSLKRKEPPRWGEPVELFNGKNLAGWKPRLPDKPNGWTVRDGALVNAKPGNDLVSERTFEDFQLHAEFRYPKGSNSGIYLRGRYEVQIEDNFGQEPDSHRMGGIYGFLTPCLNAAKPAGEWQTLDVTLVGRAVTIVLNRERIVDRQPIPG